MSDSIFDRFTRWRYAKIALTLFEVISPILPLAFFSGALLWLFPVFCIPALLFRWHRNLHEEITRESVIASLGAGAIVYLLVYVWMVLRGAL